MNAGRWWNSSARDRPSVGGKCIERPQPHKTHTRAHAQTNARIALIVQAKSDSVFHSIFRHSNCGCTANVHITPKVQFAVPRSISSMVNKKNCPVDHENDAVRKGLVFLTIRNELKRNRKRVCSVRHIARRTDDAEHTLPRKPSSLIHTLRFLQLRLLPQLVYLFYLSMHNPPFSEYLLYFTFKKI